MEALPRRLLLITANVGSLFEEVSLLFVQYSIYIEYFSKDIERFQCQLIICVTILLGLGLIWYEKCSIRFPKVTHSKRKLPTWGSCSPGILMSAWSTAFVIVVYF